MNGHPSTDEARVSDKQQGVAALRQPQKEEAAGILAYPLPTQNFEKRDFMPDTTPKTTDTNSRVFLRENTRPSRKRIDGSFQNPDGLLRS